MDVDPPEHSWFDDHDASTTLLTVPIRFRIASTIDDKFDRAGVASVRHAITRMDLSPDSDVNAILLSLVG